MIVIMIIIHSKLGKVIHPIILVLKRQGKGRSQLKATQGYTVKSRYQKKVVA